MKLLAAQLPLTIYDQSSGLTSLSVIRIYQDREGFVWVGTEKGLYRFDGVAFNQIGAEQGFQVSEVISFAEDAKGRLWAGSRAGLQLRENERFGWVRPEDKPLVTDRGQTLAADEDGGMWLVSGNHLLRLTSDAQGHWQVSSPFSSEQLRDLPGLSKVSAVFHRHGTTWFGCGTELCSLRDGQLRRYGPGANVPADKWLGFLSASDGSLWVRGIHAIRVLPEGSDAFIARDMPANSADVAASSIDIVQDREGRVLTRSSLGLARWTGQRWELFGPDDGLPGVGVSSLIVDQDDTVWIGTYGRGLLHWNSRDAVENWTVAQGLSGSLIWSVTRASSGAVWVADDLGGSVIAPWQDRAQAWPLTIAPPRQTRTVLAAADGSLWYFLFDGRVLRYEPSNGDTRVVATLPFLVRGAFQDSHGRLWAYTLGGLYEVDAQSGQIERAAPGLIPTSMCSDLAEDGAGRLWLACSSGVYRYTAGHWSHVRVLPQETLGGFESVQVTPDGRLWLSALQPGLLVGKVSDAESIDLTSVPDSLLADSRVYFLRTDHRGRLWVGGNSGVDVLDGDHWTRLDVRDGLLWDETNHGAFYADKDGSVWIGTPIGLSHLLKPEELLTPRQIHPRLVSAQYGKRELDGQGQQVDFDVGGALVLRFAVLGNSSGSPVRFRYRLSNIDRDWVEASTRELRYASLPPGSYRFELQTIDENQRRLSAPISLTFTLSPPWWRSSPAYVATVLLILVAIALAWRWRVRLLVKHAQRLEQAVAVRTGQLQNAMRARSMLLARISHDLRSPLSGIVDSVRRWREGDAQRDYPGLIESSVRQQLELIDELLEFSRDELADLELVASPGYLHAFLQGLVEHAALLAEKHRNRFEYRHAENLPALIKLDFRRLRQVLMNLIGNAAKFTNDGYILFTVSATSLQEGSVQLHFMIEDSGIGIEPSDREHLSLPFARGSNAEPYKGYGLGLAIVTQILERMDSRLNISAASGGGSCFGFVLDVPLADESELEPDLFEDDGIAGEVNGAGHTILVVDDHAQSREMLCDLLDGFGFESLPAADGDQALALLQQQSVSLIITDQAMPGMDGWELLQKVRHDYPELPVLLYSSLPPRRAEGFEELKFNDALLKPASGKQLLVRISRLLEQRSELSA
ncbi:two-component regulator propeller domain-containing protein [Dyella acidisoli]|nr:two-component regulator propeller domain-containing protein [Dyella acidisoli]